MSTVQKVPFDVLVEDVRRLFFILRALSESMLADLGCTPVERGVLNEIEERGPQSVPVLAESRRITRQAMQKAVDRMIVTGLVATKPNPRHLRSSLVAPTPSGTRLLREIHTREARVFVELDLPVSEREMRAAASTLAAVAKRLEQPDVADLAARAGSGRDTRRSRSKGERA